MAKTKLIYEMSDRAHAPIFIKRVGSEKVVMGNMGRPKMAESEKRQRIWFFLDPDLIDFYKSLDKKEKSQLVNEALRKAMRQHKSKGENK